MATVTHRYVAVGGSGKDRWNDTHVVANEGAINVKDAPYSAKGDGVKDDTAAIQAAIDAAEADGHGVVFFPDGTYRFSALTITGNNISLCGSALSVLSSTATSGAAILFDAGGTAQIVDVGMERLWLYTNADATDGVRFVRGYRHYVRNCFVHTDNSATNAAKGIVSNGDTPRYGFALDVRGSVVQGFAHQVYVYGQVTAARITNNVILGVSPVVGTDYGIWIDDYASNGGIVSDNVIEQLGYGVRIKGTGTSVVNNRFESIGTMDIVLADINVREFYLAGNLHVSGKEIEFNDATDGVCVDRSIAGTAVRFGLTTGATDGPFVRFSGGSAYGFGQVWQANVYSTAPFAQILGAITGAASIFGGTAGQEQLEIHAVRDIAIGTSSTLRLRIAESGKATLTGRVGMTGLPTSAAGLSAGDLWNDGGTLRIV